MLFVRILGDSNTHACNTKTSDMALFLYACMCQTLLNLQEPCSEEQVSPQSNAEQRSHWC